MALLIEGVDSHVVQQSWLYVELPCIDVSPRIQSCLRGVVQELNKVPHSIGEYQNLATTHHLEYQVIVLLGTKLDWQNYHMSQ